MNDSVAAALWFATNLFIASVFWTLARKWSPEDPWYSTLIHSLIASLGVVVGSAMFLGALGRLHPLTLYAVVLVVAGASAWLGRRLPLRPAHGSRTIGVAWTAIWLVALSVLITHMISFGVSNKPTDDDSLIYHLPLVDSWLQAGSCYAPFCLNWRTPGNLELVGLWTVGLYSGDFYYCLTNFPLVVLLALSTVAFCRDLGIAAPQAYLTGILAALTPVVRQQACTLENDVAAAAFFFAATHYVNRYLRSGSLSNLTLGAVAVGLLSGTKYYALPLAGVLGVGAVLVAYYAKGRSAAGKLLASGILGCCALGAYWYVRNAVVSGNPVYPLGERNLAFEDFRYGALLSSMFLTHLESSVLPLLADDLFRMAGPFHLAALMAFPALAVFLVSATIRWLHSTPGERASQPSRPLLGSLLLGTAALALVIPFSVEDEPGTLNALEQGYTPVRYNTALLTLAVVGLSDLLNFAFARLALGLGSVGGGVRTRVGLAVASVPFVIITFCIAYHLNYFWSLYFLTLDRVTFVIVLGTTLLCWTICAEYGRGGGRLAALALAAIIVVACASFGLATEEVARDWHSDYGDHFDRYMSNDVYSFLARDPRRGRTLCVFDIAYPFFGSRRQYRVCQFAHKVLDYSRTDFGAGLEERLRRWNVDLVTVPVTNGTERGEGTRRAFTQWFDERPHRFRPEYRGVRHNVYQFQPERDPRR